MRRVGIYSFKSRIGFFITLKFTCEAFDERYRIESHLFHKISQILDIVLGLPIFI